MWTTQDVNPLLHRVGDCLVKSDLTPGILNHLSVNAVLSIGATARYINKLLDEADRTICALANANDESWAIHFARTCLVPEFTTSIPDGKQDAVDQGLTACATWCVKGMDWIRQRKVPLFRPLWWHTVQFGIQFSSPTISSADVIPYCGIEMGLMCSSMIGDKYANFRQHRAWRRLQHVHGMLLCIWTGAKFYNPNINDLSYNQQALGLMPFGVHVPVFIHASVPFHRPFCVHAIWNLVSIGSNQMTSSRGRFPTFYVQTLEYSA